MKGGIIVTNIYEKCPTYKGKIITLRQTSMEDAEELLKCYSDEKSVPFLTNMMTIL
ncbi:hypothetical protein HMPREF1982_04506 [Clostridiales bacterium oral taxon 876 str. F0540]|nr:hypothetical protein HMPREF1982_04506 [Clostridiales bacterium oral taxon 876 str. F0540]